MTWIRTIDEEDAAGEIANVYSRMAGKPGSRIANVLKCQSLDPGALDAHYSLYHAVMRGTRSLSRAEREMIAVVVSRVNECHY